MNPPVLTLLNNKGGVGKTSLVYHLAHMFSLLGKEVLAVDLDPQANLTAALLDEDQIHELWENHNTSSTIYQSLRNLTEVGDIVPPTLKKIRESLYLIPGDMNLTKYENTLSDSWPKCLDSELYRHLRIISAFWQIIQLALREVKPDLVLIDVGPHLGALNRSALIATDYVIIPLGTDLFSLQGLKVLGPTLKNWKEAWKSRLQHWQKEYDRTNPKHQEFELPSGQMEPIGYLCQQYSVRLERPVKAYDRWANRIPQVYREAVLEQKEIVEMKPAEDPYCLGLIKHYRSLVPMAQEHRKPIFELSPADGAIGSHANAVQDAKKDFKLLAEKIAGKIGISSLGENIL